MKHSLLLFVAFLMACSPPEHSQSPARTDTAELTRSRAAVHVEQSVEACAVPELDLADWQTAAQKHTVLRVPPGYIDEGRIGKMVPGEFAWWRWRQGEGKLSNTRSVMYQWDAPGPVPGGYDLSKPNQFRDRQDCRLLIQGRVAHVASGWIRDASSPTGRTYHNIAAWADVEPGTHLWLVTRAESASEQTRLLGIIYSLHFR